MTPKKCAQALRHFARLCPHVLGTRVEFKCFQRWLLFRRSWISRTERRRSRFQLAKDRGEGVDYVLSTRIANTPRNGEFYVLKHCKRVVSDLYFRQQTWSGLDPRRLSSCADHVDGDTQRLFCKKTRVRVNDCTNGVKAASWLIDPSCMAESPQRRKREHVGQKSWLSSRVRLPWYPNQHEKHVFVQARMKG